MANVIETGRKRDALDLIRIKLMTDKKHPGCTGCLTADDGRCYLNIKDPNKCPCQLCLVKTMCGTPCEEYNTFIVLEEQ